MNTIVIEGVRDCKLEHVFECGQCFRWNDEYGDGSYVGVANGYICHATLDNSGTENGILVLEVSGGDERFWRNYFDLDRDYSDYKKALIAREPKIEKAIEECYGIRILRQDFFEVLISFIISQNNNIPRIKSLISGISKAYGEELGEYNGEVRYSFPSPKAIAQCDVEDLKALKLGYRCEYIKQSAMQYLEEGRPSLELSSEEVHKRLLSYHGVGPKVANCIQLFGCRDFRAFPVDVWVKKIMNDMYGFKENDIRGMQEFALEHFGELSGIAQQYLFFYYRGR